MGLEKGSLCVYCCKSSQMQDDKFQLVPVRLTHEQGGFALMLIPPNSPEAKAGQISPFPNVFLVLGSLVLEDFLKVTSSHPCLQASRLTNQCSSQ